MKIRRSVAFRSKLVALKVRRIKAAPSVTSRGYRHNRPMRNTYVYECIDRRIECFREDGKFILKRDC